MKLIENDTVPIRTYGIYPLHDVNFLASLAVDLFTHSPVYRIMHPLRTLSYDQLTSSRSTRNGSLTCDLSGLMNYDEIN
jgi:hypothetical protein